MQSYLDYRRHRDVLSKEGPPKSDFVDRQMAKAVEYVTEQVTGDKKPDSTAKADAEKPSEKAPEKPDEKSGDKPGGKSGDKSPPKKNDAQDDGAKPDSKNPLRSQNEARAREVLRRLRELHAHISVAPAAAA